MRFLLRLIINTAALWVAARVVPGISYVGGPGGLVAVAVIFGVVNALIGPFLRLLALPVVVLTLGLFTLVVNGALFALAGLLARALGIAFHVGGAWAAILGALVVSVVSFVLTLFVADRASH